MTVVNWRIIITLLFYVTYFRYHLMHTYFSLFVLRFQNLKNMIFKDFYSVQFVHSFSERMSITLIEITLDVYIHVNRFILQYCVCVSVVTVCAISLKLYSHRVSFRSYDTSNYFFSILT